MKVLQRIQPEDFLFFDIETAPLYEKLTEESPMFDAWEYQCAKSDNVEDVFEEYDKRSSLQAEFSRVCCISIAVVHEGKIHVKSLYGPDERKILEDLSELLKKVTNRKTHLCGHNIVDFDIPFMMKRYLINHMTVPEVFDTAHLKPWEVQCVDTALLWRGTSFRKTSLIGVTMSMGHPSPKDDLQGSEVRGAFFRGEHKRIATYCEKDTVACAQLVFQWRDGDTKEVAQSELTREPQGLLTELFNGAEVTPEVVEELKGRLEKLSPAERAEAFVILYAIPSKASGKETHLTKAHVKALENYFKEKE